VARARRRWMREQGTLYTTRLVFIDETAANTKMVRLSGRCLRGDRLVGHVPYGHWKTITFVAGLRRNGMTAPCVLDGSMTGKTFLAYVVSCQRSSAMTSSSSTTSRRTKFPGVREAIEARGATLRYLPQYSPDLNPIEMPFSKPKACLRRVAERTVPRLYRRIGSFARSPTAQEARNYFMHAGYA
jgi:DDE superfamily endonuclease